MLQVGVPWAESVRARVLQHLLPNRAGINQQKKKKKKEFKITNAKCSSSFSRFSVPSVFPPRCKTPEAYLIEFPDEALLFLEPSDPALLFQEMYVLQFSFLAMRNPPSLLQDPPSEWSWFWIRSSSCKRYAVIERTRSNDLWRYFERAAYRRNCGDTEETIRHSL